MIKVERVLRYGVATLENTVADAMRREQCMCLHCTKLHPKQLDNCVMAEMMYAFCTTKGGAVCVTRCQDFEQK